MPQVTLFEREIREQPESLARLLRDGREAVEKAAAAIRARNPQWVIIAARGSSDNAARYAQYVLGLRNQLAVGLATPSLFTLYGASPRMEHALVIGISQSGQSPDIVAVLEAGRKSGAVTLAITNDPASPLAGAAEHVVPFCAGTEQAVAASKTYAAALCATAMLSAALATDTDAWTALDAIPAAVERTLALNASLDRPARSLRDVGQLAVVGRGLNFCTAFEIALKVKETGYMLAEPHSFADFRHGHVAVVSRGFHALVVAPSGRTEIDAIELLDLMSERHASTIALSDSREVLRRAQHALPLPTGVPEWLSPIVAVVPGQLLALAFAVARGLDPDNPRGLAKVTLTR
jgi:glucosamine--fructose-6-phosphate aminotransferase (isomerizing)